MRDTGKNWIIPGSNDKHNSERFGQDITLGWSCQKRTIDRALFRVGMDIIDIILDMQKREIYLCKVDEEGIISVTKVLEVDVSITIWKA